MATLSTPYYESPDGRIVLYHGDCREILPLLDDASIDALVTDPPYGIGFYYAGKRELANGADQYWQWLEPRYKEMMRALAPGGLYAIWQAQAHFEHFWTWFGPNIHIYCSAKNFVQVRPKSPVTLAYDPVVLGYKTGSPPRRPVKPNRNMDYFVANTASVVSAPSRLERGHPCPRPLDAVQEVIENFALPSGLILDPFAGSGTTLRAAKDLGRRAIGIEIEERYCAIAVQRLAQEVLPLEGAA